MRSGASDFDIYALPLCSASASAHPGSNKHELSLFIITGFIDSKSRLCTTIYALCPWPVGRAKGDGTAQANIAQHPHFRRSARPLSSVLLSNRDGLLALLHLPHSPYHLHCPLPHPHALGTTASQHELPRLLVPVLAAAVLLRDRHRERILVLGLRPQRERVGGRQPRRPRRRLEARDPEDHEEAPRELRRGSPHLHRGPFCEERHRPGWPAEGSQVRQLLLDEVHVRLGHCFYTGACTRTSTHARYYSVSPALSRKPVYPKCSSALGGL